MNDIKALLEELLHEKRTGKLQSLDVEQRAENLIDALDKAAQRPAATVSYDTSIAVVSANLPPETDLYTPLGALAAKGGTGKPSQAQDQDCWLPIGTAPKDRAILLREGGDIYKAQWDAKGGYWGVHCGQPVSYTPEPDSWTEIPGGADAIPTKPEIKRVCELAIGTRFSFMEHPEDIWVLLNHEGLGLCAKWEGIERTARQSICSIAETESELLALDVIIR